LITAKYGPNYDKFPGSKADYDSQQPIAANGGNGYYPAAFTNNPNSCDLNGNPTGSYTYTDDFGNQITAPNTTLRLKPGIYVSVVEIVKADNSQTAAVQGPAGSAGQQALPGRGEVQDLMMYDFYSKWGDAYESVMIPLPVFVWTQRGGTGISSYTSLPVTVSDTYWIAGFEATYGPDKDKRYDILGKEIAAHGQYQGDDGYFMADSEKPLQANLYGPYPQRPTTNSDQFCKNTFTAGGNTYNTLTKSWSNIDLKDITGAPGWTPGVTISERKFNIDWYVFQFGYGATGPGSDRLWNFKTDCSDNDEIFRVTSFEGGNEPKLVTQVSAGQPKAPTVIKDRVDVYGVVDDDSIAKLTLYRRLGAENDHNTDELLCTVHFKVSGMGVYYTEDYYTDQNTGQVKAANGSGYCFAKEAGHYYWREEFYKPGTDIDRPKPDDELQPPQNGGPGEEIDLEKNAPEVETNADQVAYVGQPFRDVAYVTLPEGDNNNKYYLWFTAYGPTQEGEVYCSGNEVFTTIDRKITVTESGSYTSPSTTVPTPGYIYWIEHLEDEDGNIVDEGKCGAANEITRVHETPPPPTPPGGWEWTPFVPDSGFVTRQVLKITVLSAIIALGAWQLTSKNSWLFRKR
jgi:hypothetical protein